MAEDTKTEPLKPDELHLAEGHTTRPDAQWFPEAKLGAFFHWGISTIGEDVDISWGMFKDFEYCPKKVTPEEYFGYAKSFNPKKYDPEKWIKAIKEAGFKYAVLTTRHHDSFALWPSNYGSFNTNNYMDGRDLVGEYVDACRKYGIKVGFYYSPPDFYTEREYLSFGGWHSGGLVGQPVPSYIRDYQRAIVRGQLYELFTRYGKIDVIWFDGEGLDFMPREEIYQYQPGIVIGRGGMTDFRSTECQIPDENYYHEKLEGHWWECCHEWCSCWGYISDEYYKPTETIIGWYNTVVKQMHGNLLINFGPNKDGELPPPAYERLKEFGAWLKENG